MPTRSCHPLPPSSPGTVDIAVVGAGLAGLTCARTLQQTGYRVAVLEKSRGVGGRVATRRIDDVLRADHGLPAIAPQGELTRALIERLQAKKVLQLWRETASGAWEYAAPAGMTAIAKFLASDLEIWKQTRVQALGVSDDRLWELQPTGVRAKALVLAIPAPQAHQILAASTFAPMPSEAIAQLARVEYDPCVTVMAGYATPSSLPEWKAIAPPPPSPLSWISFDGSKRGEPALPIFVSHSTPEFARAYLDATDLEPAARILLAGAAEVVGAWMQHPEWYQVHRWRYAMPRRSLASPCLATVDPLPLVCCGDWCGTDGASDCVELALRSGQAAAAYLEPLGSYCTNR